MILGAFRSLQASTSAAPGETYDNADFDKLAGSGYRGLHRHGHAVTQRKAAGLLKAKPAPIM
jgi:hypothetical protein